MTNEPEEQQVPFIKDAEDQVIFMQYQDGTIKVELRKDGDIDKQRKILGQLAQLVSNQYDASLGALQEAHRELNQREADAKRT